MGAGIADVLAGTGIEVRLYDADPARSRAASLQDAVRDADIVIEAIVEDLASKQELFAALDRHTSPPTILASNTSSLPISRIASAVSQPARVLGMHFFNPVPKMKLVELVVHEDTDPAVLDAARGLVTAIGKTSIVVRDSPGFASSRLGVALGLEAMRMLEAGVASAEDIDTAMTLGYGHPMGPLRVSDLVGLDVRLRIAEHLHRELRAPQFEPPAILRRKVKAGELGRKTGKGFYDWASER
jgi:3-hydroxybutyryl-CoA dehydrogenase